MSSFYEIAFTPSVQQQQDLHGSRRQYDRMTEARAGENTLGPDEQNFIARRDSFYMASVSETGWPYLQHRGGDPGFVHVLSPSQIAFADFSGNKQYISAGNLLHDGRVALFFMDYPNQTRLKLLGRAEIREASTLSPEDLAPFRTAGDRVEHLITIHIEGFDWNCPQHITPRYTAAELESALAPLRLRLKTLEEENERLRSNLTST